MKIIIINESHEGEPELKNLYLTLERRDYCIKEDCVPIRPKISTKFNNPKKLSVLTAALLSTQCFIV